MQHAQPSVSAVPHLQISAQLVKLVDVDPQTMTANCALYCYICTILLVATERPPFQLKHTHTTYMFSCTFTLFPVSTGIPSDFQGDQDYAESWLINRLPWWLRQKESACNVGDSGLIPGSGRSPGEGDGYPLQCSCLENPMDRGAWRAAVHGISKGCSPWDLKGLQSMGSQSTGHNALVTKVTNTTTWVVEH